LALSLTSAPAPAAERSPAQWDAILERARAAARAIPGDPPESIHYMTFASSTDPLSTLVGGGSDKKVDSVYTVFQIRYRRGWIMVDAGMDSEVDPNVPIPLDRYQQIQRALLGANLNLVTHEHHDHAAGVIRSASLPQIAAKTLLTKAQLTTLLERPNLPIIKLSPEAAAAYLTIDYDPLYPVAPGVVLMAAPGHSPGSQVTYVRLASGKEALMIGDIVWNMAGVTELKQKPEAISKDLGEDREQLKGQIEWLNTVLNRKDIALIPCHDKEWLLGLERAKILRAGLDLKVQ